MFCPVLRIDVRLPANHHRRQVPSNYCVWFCGVDGKPVSPVWRSVQNLPLCRYGVSPESCARRPSQPRRRIKGLGRYFNQHFHIEEILQHDAQTTIVVGFRLRHHAFDHFFLQHKVHIDHIVCHFAQSEQSGVEILYGRLPTIFFLPSMLLKSNCNTSPSCITNLSANGKVFRRRTMSRSISQTCRQLSFFAKGSVMAAKPGPIQSRYHQAAV